MKTITNIYRYMEDKRIDITPFIYILIMATVFALGI